MQGKFLFEYAVIRIVPMVQREEFINAGVILYCREFKYLDTLYNVNKDRLQIICAALDWQEIEQHMRSIKRICAGDSEGGPIAALDVSSRFRWLTATRSTVVQTSKVHPGFCSSPQQALQQLFEQLVL